MSTLAIRVLAGLGAIAAPCLAQISATRIELEQQLAISLIVSDISGDGTTVVGRTGVFGGPAGFFHWRSGGPGASLVEPVFDSSIIAVNAFSSDDGSVMIGTRAGFNTLPRFYRWIEGDQDARPYSLANGGTTIYGASRNGNVVAGVAHLNGVGRAFRYVIDEQLDLIEPPDGYLHGGAFGVSDDLTTMAVGFSVDPDDPDIITRSRAGFWTEGSGVSFIEFDASLEIVDTRAWHISRDGGTIIGTITTTDGEKHGYMARPSEPARVFDDADWDEVHDITPDGSMVTGLVDVDGDRQLAIWTEETGTVPFRSLLGDLGQSLPAFENGPLNVSDDGKRFAANIGNLPYLITIPPPATLTLLGLVAIAPRRRAIGARQG